MKGHVTSGRYACVHTLFVEIFRTLFGKKASSDHNQNFHTCSGLTYLGENSAWKQPISKSFLIYEIFCVKITKSRPVAETQGNPLFPRAILLIFA